MLCHVYQFSLHVMWHFEGGLDSKSCDIVSVLSSAGNSVSSSSCKRLRNHGVLAVSSHVKRTRHCRLLEYLALQSGDFLSFGEFSPSTIRKNARVPASVGFGAMKRSS